MKKTHNPDTIALIIVRWILAFGLVTIVSISVAKHAINEGASLMQAHAADLSWETQKKEIMSDLKEGYEDYSNEPTIVQNSSTRWFAYTKCIVRAYFTRDSFASHTCKSLITQ